MTWNLWGRFGEYERRAPAIAAVLQAEAPDILCVQEVWSDASHDQADDLATILDGNVARTTPVMFDGFSFGNAIVSRWPIEVLTEERLPNADGQPGHRRLLVAAVETPWGRWPAAVTHLDHRFDASATRRQQVERVLEVIDAQRGTGDVDLPLILGGDHSIAMGSLSGVAAHARAQDESVGLIWFDAHGDMNLPGISPSGNIHGMPLSHLLGHGDEELRMIKGFAPKIRPENVALIGIRDIDAGERKVIRDSGIHAFTMRDIDEQGMAQVAQRALEIVNDGTAGYHVSFDVDGCDPDVIPGTGTRVPGGVNYREAHLLLEYIADNGAMTSMDVVELNPFLDHKNLSAERTLHLILSAMGQSIL